MSGHQTATIDDTVFFWFAANDTSGSGGDGATPLFDVREAGAAASAVPLLSGTPTLLSDAGYPAGCYEISIAATTGNGFAANDTFAVFCTLAIDAQNPSGFVGSCTLTPLAKVAALVTAQTDLDTLTGSDGVTLATTQGNYAPLKPTVAGRDLDVTAAGEAGLDLDNTSGTLAAAQFASGFITAAKFGAGAIDAAALATDAVDEISDGVWNELLAGHVVADSTGLLLNEWQDGGRLDLILDIIAVDTTTDIPALITTAQADLDTITGADGVTLATAQALYAPSKAGDAMTLTAAGVDLIWDELLAGHLTADSTGLLLNEWQDGGRLDLILDARMAEASIDTTGGAVDVVTLVDTTTANTDMRGTDSAALASVVGALADAAAAGDPTSADTLMQYVKQLINTLEGAVGIPVFPAEGAPANNVSIVEVLRAIHADVTGLAGAAMRGTDSVDTAAMRGTDSALLASADGSGFTAIPWNAAWDAEVESEVNDALDTTIAELGVGVPAATPTLRTGLMFMYMGARNKRDTTSTSDEIHNDAGTVIATAVLSDDTVTYIKAEYA